MDPRCGLSTPISPPGTPHINPWRTTAGDERLIEWQCFSLPGSDTQPVVVGVGHELTERQREEEAVRESEARFRTMADTAPAMLWIRDPSGYGTFLSRGWYEFTGQTEETALGFGWLNAVHPEDRDYTRDTLLAANEKREPFALDYRLLRRDGVSRWAVDSGRPGFGLNEEFLGYIGSVVDITERKQAEAEREAARAEAERLNRAKDEFLAMLGHELRNPLAAITSAFGVLDRTEKQDDRAVRARDIVKRQAGHLRRLVDDLLDLARVTRGKIALDREPIDLCATVELCVSILDAAGRLAQHRVELDFTGVWINADVTRVEQIITNLLTNAIRYTPSGGRIAVRVNAEDEQAVLRVSDSGVGIAPELLPRMFDVFAQGERGLDRKEGGLGIGLTLVRQLTELHGGRVEAHSDGPGRGSEFVVRLPRIVAPRKAAGQVLKAAGEAAPAASLRLGGAC